MAVSEVEARKVALWWWQAITTPGQNMGSEEEGGNDMANMLGTILAAEAKPSEDKKEKFVTTLTDIIMKSDIMELYCDYAPDTYLSEAANIAGIDTNCFPWKTSTRIEEGNSMYSRGYRAPYEKIVI